MPYALEPRITQPPWLDLAVSANDVIFWSTPILGHEGGGARSLYTDQCMVSREMKHPTPDPRRQPRLLEGWRF